MNSRERVLTTINHQEPDRVPVGEWGIDHDHVSKILGKHTYWRNRKDTTLALWQNRRDEVVEGMKEDCCKLVDALDYDIITVELVPPKSHHVTDAPRLIKEGTWMDSKGNVYRYAPSNDSISLVQSGPGAPEFKEELDDEDIQNAWDAIHNFDESRFELIDYIADKYAGKKAILCRSIDVYGHLMAPFHGTYEEQMMLTLLAPEEIKRMQDVCVAYNHLIIEHCQKKGVDIVMQGQDFGMNIGTIMSPDSIRDLYVPVMKRTNDDAAAHGLATFYHCCGNIWDIMDDFVGAGYQGYQSIQESAGMDSVRVKQMYGDKLTLWTGIQCETLIQGTPAEVDREVNHHLETLMPGGGFIFGSTNSVQYGAKTENYLQALDILRKNGVYR
ncbi:MAG: hypothetical protein IJ315_00730 [Firmicutes bacterium]|nr:hypothetical protein [Bacillota bacterium]